MEEGEISRTPKKSEYHSFVETIKPKAKNNYKKNLLSICSHLLTSHQLLYLIHFNRNVCHQIKGSAF